MTARSVFEQKMREKYSYYPLDRWITPNLNDEYVSGFIHEAWQTWEKYTSKNNLSNPTDIDYDQFHVIEILRKTTV